MTETSGNGDSSCSIDTSGEAIKLDAMSVVFLSPLWDLGSNNLVEDANECTKYRCNEIRDSTPNQYGLYEIPSVALSTLIGTSSPFPTLSRSTNFWILPVAVVGNWSTKHQSFGVL